MQRLLQKLSIWLFRKSFDLSNNKTKTRKGGSNSGSIKNIK